MACEKAHQALGTSAGFSNVWKFAVRIFQTLGFFIQALEPDPITGRFSRR
ncbi:MAG: hypothetical protein K9M45_08740 [Kiritimatiellales bacterium]|nr:hypothetical protein [Kiritimatiellales bacterium]